MTSAFPTFRILAGTFLLLSLSAQAEPRTFTSPDGRTLQAEIESATSKQVTLKLPNGSSLEVEVTKFSKADQAYIAEWRKANPVTIKYNFAANYTKEKTNSSKSIRDSHEIVTETWLCNVKLANRSGQTLDGLRMDYEIYYTQNSNNQPVIRKMAGSTKIESLKNLEEVTLPTKELKLITSKLEGGRYYIDGSRSRQKDSIEGVSLKMIHNGKTAFEWASSGVPKDRKETSVE